MIDTRNYTIERRDGDSSTPKDVGDGTLNVALTGLSNKVYDVGDSLHSWTNVSYPKIAIKTRLGPCLLSFPHSSRGGSWFSQVVP